MQYLVPRKSDGDSIRPIKWAIKSLKVLGVNLEEKTASKIGEMIDQRKSLPKRPGPGLYRCSTTTEQFELMPVAREKSSIEQPYLLFIHGTGSSTWGSFGDLWSEMRRKGDPGHSGIVQ